MTGVVVWSDVLYRIHGYQRGEVVPTVKLFLAHKHPGDRAKIRELHTGLAEVGGTPPATNA